MDKTEPTFVPEWLKSSGSLTTTSSSLHSDDQGVSKPVRNKSLGSNGDNDLVTSSYFRRASSSNGPGSGSARIRSYSSFNRNRDKDWEKDYFDPLGNILPSRFERDGLRRSHSNLSWPRKVGVEKNKNINGHNNGKIPFEKDFPSLGSEEKQVDSNQTSGLTLASVVQSLPIGNSGVTGGDVWTSALAEVPVQSTSISVTTNAATGRNMAETLVQGSPRVQAAPQLSVGTQRLEELAVKQSRQLIPMTPSLPKALAMNSSDKSKQKVGQSSHMVNHSPSSRLVSVKYDVSKTSSSSSSSGKLHVLKPSRERNGTTKESSSLSPTGGSSKLPNSPLVAPAVVVNSAPLEKRPSPQAKSRNDFFNLMRKKSMANNSSHVAPEIPSPDSTNDNPGEGGTQDSCEVQPSGQNKVDFDLTERSTNNGKNHSGSDAIWYSEEEEARFLKSLGWEETTEEEGLTEEEINSFYRDVSKYMKFKTASSFFKGTQPPKSLMSFNLQMGKNGDISTNAKMDS